MTGGTPALVIGCSAGRVAQDGIGGYSGSQRGGIRIGMYVGVVGADQAPVGATNLRLRGIRVHVQDRIEILIFRCHRSCPCGCPGADGGTWGYGTVADQAAARVLRGMMHSSPAARSPSGRSASQNG